MVLGLSAQCRTGFWGEDWRDSARMANFHDHMILPVITRAVHRAYRLVTSLSSLVTLCTTEQVCSNDTRVIRLVKSPSHIYQFDPDSHDYFVYGRMYEGSFFV